MQRLPISLPVIPTPAIDSSRAEFARGLVYTHNRANANTAELHKTNVTLAALIDLLVERGLVDGDELNERRQLLAEELKRDYVSRGMAVAMQDFDVSKYEFKGGAEIDCESRLHLCKAACCRLPFALSKHDVQEGVVKWDLGQPYMNARDDDGYCVHMNKETHQCSVYHQRPIPCRGYDCRKDKRVWIDFENRVINPLLDTPDWPNGCEAQSQASTPGQS